MFAEGEGALRGTAVFRANEARLGQAPPNHPEDAVPWSCVPHVGTSGHGTVRPRGWLTGTSGVCRRLVGHAECANVHGLFRELGREGGRRGCWTHSASKADTHSADRLRLSGAARAHGGQKPARWPRQETGADQESVTTPGRDITRTSPHILYSQSREGRTGSKNGQSWMRHSNEPQEEGGKRRKQRAPSALKGESICSLLRTDGSFQSSKRVRRWSMWRRSRGTAGSSSWAW
jgi:hypothetical protein